MVIRQCCIDGCGNRIYLCGIPCSEYGQYAKRGKQIRQPVPVLFQSVLNIIHWASDQIPMHIFLPEMHRKRHFRKLRTHTENCGNPHPEHGSRPADGNGSCHPGNISRADRCRKCRTDRLKRCHGSVRCLTLLKHTAKCHFHRVWELADL